MPVDHDIDHEARILTIRLTGDVSGAEALRETEKIWTGHPEVMGYYSLIESTRFTGDIGFSDIVAIAAAYYQFFRGKDLGRKVAIVSIDPSIATWTKVISTCFPSRQFAVFETQENARAWLLAKA